MKIIIVITIFLTLVTIQQISKSKECTCTELLVQNDCLRSPGCVWDNYNLKCSQQQKNSTVVAVTPQTTQIKVQEMSKTHSAFCFELSMTDCPKQNSCAWLDNVCTHFTGCTAYSKSTNEECKAISSRCITDGFRCVEISDCGNYKTQISCVSNQSDKLCYWNQYKCEDADTCEKLPITLKTDSECRQIISNCTAKDGGGCVLSGYACADQVSEISCVTNQLRDIDCLWVDQRCVDKTCSNAPNKLITDKECSEIQPQCTTKIGGGCVIRGSCADAQNQASCLKDYLGNSCFWNGQSCSDRFCQYGPSTFNTNEQCQTILPQCITTGSGCTYSFACSTAMIKEACTKDSEGKECFWNGNVCLTKTCDIAGNSYQGDDQCRNFMIKCKGKSNGQSGCDDKVCEDASKEIITNEQCDQFMPSGKCITKAGGGCKKNTNCFSIDVEVGCVRDLSGNICYWDEIQNKCFPLTSCAQIQSQRNCLKDQQNRQCEWVIPNLNNQNPYCDVKSCFTAPKSLISEKECQQYFTPSNQESCTVAKNGGCTIKYQCSNASNVGACTTDNQDNQCYWEVNNQICRLAECTDLLGNTFLECNSQMKSCTIGNEGKCSEMKECNSFMNQLDCVYGIEGPCIWINDYPTYGSKGFCFKYDKCETFLWSSDSMCKMISPNCTTDGEKCVPITDCAHSNINGGCVTGTDGVCVQTPKILGSNEPEICKKFFRCNNAFYLTHNECQKANPSCTTDALFGCMELTSCQYYSKESCYFNDAGIETNKRGQVISTGKCIWNNFECVDESCSDFSFTTPQQCSNKLSLCTSNGQKCIQKTPCETYSQIDQCNTGGSDGACLWESQICKRKQCNDIVNGITQEICSEVDNCISDGTKCIQISSCSNYKTAIACQSNGTDGVCVYTGKCQVMNNCASASNDKVACNKANDRCKWISETSYTPSQCLDHTCETYQAKVGYCSFFFTWDYSQQILCKNIEGKCTQVDVSILNEDDCYVLSIHQYAWNPISNKCSKCDKTQSTKTNTTKPGNNSVTNSIGYIASVLVSFLTN